MFYQTNHNNAGWYFDIIDENGLEVACGAYFRTEALAVIAAEYELLKRGK